MDNSIFQSVLIQEAEPFTIMKQVETGNTITTYIGFAQPGTKTEHESKFRIVRITEYKDTFITTRMYAEGSKERKFVFSDAENYNYYFEK